jgi:hypothetical protein
MSDDIQHFLLVFDHRVGHLIHIEAFGDDVHAVAAYASTEATYAHCKDVEVVLIGSDSIETVRRTHGNYFEPTPPVSRYLAGI